MPDVRQSFEVLENPSTGAGVPLHHSQEGDAAAARNAAAMLVAKDGSNLLQYLQIDASGNLKVITGNADIVCLSDYGTDPGNAAFQDIATITLAASKVYKDIAYIFSCFRSALGEIVWEDDVGGTPTETILGVIRVGAGDLTDSATVACATFTSGGTGVQELRLRGKNLNVTSTMDATLAVAEVQ